MASDIALEEPTNSEELSPDGASSPPGAHGVEPAPGIDVRSSRSSDYSKRLILGHVDLR